MTGRKGPSPLGMAEHFGRNLAKSAEIATASHSVISARLALGAEAAKGPTPAHLAEAARMTGEKVAAFGEAAILATPSAMRMGETIADSALAETAAAMKAGREAADAGSPMGMAAVGARYAMEASHRTLEAWASLTDLALGAQTAALGPVHRTATGNARRLKRP